MTTETDLFAVPVIRDTVDLEEWRDACVSSATATLQAEVKALRAEVERLRTDLMESDEIREKLGHLLTRTAAALKGEPPAGVWHSWHDLPEKAAQLAEALRELEKREQRDEALLRQTLYALEILRDGLLQMKEHAEDYGKRWAAAYIKELRDLSPGSAEEKFHLLGILQDRLAAVSMGVRKGYAAIIALRERLVKGEQQ